MYDPMGKIERIMGNPFNYNNLRMLSVLAHPDDESFGMGGTLALYARRGASVYLVCATRGEVGDVDAEHMNGYKTAGEAREAELRCAAGKLGLAGVYFLGYRDSGMPGSPDNHHPQALAAAPLEEAAAKVVHYIRLLKPQVVLTFDPIGGYRHPDHIAIHNATVRAFEAAGDPGWQPPAPLTEDLPPYRAQKLYFHTMSRRFIRVAIKVMPIFGRDPHKFGRNGDVDLASLAGDDFPVHAAIDYRRVSRLKAEASACHASQGGMGMTQGIMSWFMRLTGSKDLFMRAYPPPTNGHRESDLFEGIDASWINQAG
jgi:N-acetyl-1-D-myo-inositol-2-amino-2-deoxy-alpha-D-glucopyranoside deacetylase